MDKTVLTLAVDSSQVGTAAAAFDRMVNAGNAAATSAGRVTSATLLEGRTISQTLIPALTNSINRTRTLDEVQAELGRDASRQFGPNLASMRTSTESTGTAMRDAVTNARLSGEQAVPRVTQTVRPTSVSPTVASVAPVLGPINTNGITQLASAAAGARLAIDRQTEAVNASRTAFVQLAQAAEATARSYRQPNQAPVSSAAAQAPSTASAALTAAPQASPNAMREAAQAMSATAAQASRVATTVTEANRAIAATPRITAAAANVPAVRAPLAVQSVTNAATGQRVPTSAAPVAQLAADAGRAQTTVERLTAAARSQRSALGELAPAASAAAASYRQIAAAPIRMESSQGISATATALANVAAQAQNANRAIAGLNRTVPASQSVASQTIARQTATSTTTNVGGTAPNAAGMNAFAAAAARGTTAVNGLAQAEGRVGEAARAMAEANARNEAALARLASAIQRVTEAQNSLSNASRTPNNTEAVAQAQTRLQSAQAAVSVATANAARTQRSAADATERHRIALQAAGRQSQLTSFQTQQLHFQLHDFFVQVASGGSPLTALIQQGSQLSGTFGGAGGAFRAIMSVLTPMRIALGGAAGAVAALGYAFYEGSRQSKAFADAVVLTGNYAGLTEGKLTGLTREIASHGQVTANAAREAAQAAISSGQVGPQVFAQATEAIALYAQATDQTAADVVKDFASMAQSPSKWAEEHNRTLHFITAAQYDAIKAFEDGGKAADAQAIIYTALIERLHKLDPNLGAIERTLRSVKGAWSSFWDAAYDIGRTETIEGKIASLDAKIRESRRGSNPFAPAPQSRTAQLAGSDPKSLEYELQDQLAGQARKDADAANEADKAQAQQAGIAAKSVIDSYLKRGKAASAYKDALDKLNRSFKDAEAAGTPVSDADKKVARTELKKEFTPAKNSEAAQVLRAQLQNDLKGIQDVLQAERDALNFQQNYLQSAYQRGGVSLTDYYEQRRKAIAEGVAAELEELDKEKARLEQYLGQTKDPSEKVQTRTRINEIDAEKSKIELRGSRDTVLVNEEESSSYRALSEQVTAYRANLLQMQGDEAGAAALRAQTAITNAKVLAAQANSLPGAPKVDVEGLTRAIQVTDQFNEVQRQTSILTSNSTRAEEAYLLVAEQSGKSLMETERGLYALRVNELDQLGALARKAKELADASTDPKIKAFAAELALEYAKAANAIDPALNRLRDANRELAAGLAQSIGNAPNAFVEFYSQRRTQSEQDIRSQKEEYSKRIDQLRGYLSQEKDERNKATLQKRINQLQGESDGLNVESKGKTVLEGIKKTVLEPMAQQISTSISKILVEAPLQKYIEGQLKGLTEGDGALAGIFKDALGIKTDPKDQALLQQTAVINASTSALDALKTAAENAANALNKPLTGARPQGGQPAASDTRGGAVSQGTDPSQPPAIDSDLAGVQSDVTESLQVFDKQTVTTASDVLKLASAAGEGGNAMVRLPGIVGLFQSAVMAMQTSGSSGSGGIGGFFAKLFGKSDTASSGDYAANDWLAAAEGGYITGPGTGTSDSIAARLSNGEFVMPAAKTKLFLPILEQMRSGDESVFANAPRYHTGGIVGKAADKASEKLKHNEVPAILMGGPKGKREEVLHADDPRHRDNLGMSIVARILNESKSSKHVSAKEAKTSESRSTVSTLLQTIAGGEGKGESSANVLAGLLDRLGVKDAPESAVATAIKVRGARELGGPVSAGGMYRVNEKGPELLEVAGKQYLMMGSQGGHVQANNAGKGQATTTNINVQVTAQTGMSRATAQQQGLQIGRGIELSKKRNG